MPVLNMHFFADY